MKQRIKGIIGILIMLAAIVATYFWVTYGQSKIESVTLLVAKNDIPQGTAIENAAEYFKPRKLSIDAAVKGAVKPEEIAQLSGRTTSQFIASNSQVVAQSFENDRLSLKKNEFVFKLPPTWVYSIPSSIRRGDKIKIYEIDSKIDNSLSANENAVVIPSVKGKPEPILQTTVVYVKDSTNREVTDTTEKQRLDATSQVSAVEIICTREETQVLENSVLGGKKLIVVYM